jgi:multidrug efflux pump subunit AcrB/outer membrane protein TolC
MSWTTWLLRNRYAVWAFVIASVIFGGSAWRRIPVRLFPDTAPPLVNVITPWPGASAADVDRDLSAPLEEAFAALEGVGTVRSSSQDNLSMVTVEFQYGTAVDLAAVDVQNAVARLGDELPGGAGNPRVVTFSTADRPVYSTSIVAADPVEARRLAEDVIAPRLQQLAGVAAVDVFGAGAPEVRVEVDPVAAEAHRAPLPQVAQAVAQSRLTAPAGRVRGEREQLMLRVDERPRDPAALAAVPLGTPDGRQVLVGDLATVQRGAADAESWFSVNGRPGVAVQVFRSEDANTVEVVARVREEAARLAAEHPALSFVEGEEAATFTARSVDSLLGNVLQALALSALLLFFFLGRVRTSLLTAVSMPLSYALTFAGMLWWGLDFNLVTLSAVILAVGMVVDATVVVLENIVRLRDEEGLDPETSAIRGADEVLQPVIAGVATTLVVLIPLLSLQGFVGKVFGPLAMTLLIAFSSSVVVALGVVPVLSLYARDGGRLDALAGRLSGPFLALMDRVRDAYLGLLRVGLRRPAGVIVVALLAFALGVRGLLAAGMDVLPRMDAGALSISVETPSGSALAETVRVMAEVERLALAQPEVRLVQSQAGYEPGMKFAGGEGVMGPTQGFASLTLSDRTDRDTTVWEVRDRLRAAIDAIPGVARVTVKETGSTAKATVLAPLVVRVSGPDPVVLDALGERVVEALRPIPNVVQPSRGWHRDLERTVLRVDDAEAARLGTDAARVAAALAMGSEGLPAGSWTPEGGSREPVRVRFARPPSPRLEDTLDWPIFLGSGAIVPARALARPERVVEQGLFTREDRGAVLDVKANVDGRPLSFVVADAERVIAGLTAPEGYAFSVRGENDDLVASRAELLRAIATSVLAVYLLLVAQFRSFIHPITVMMSVPLSLSGVSAALSLAGKPVSMPVMVGLVLLVGTVVNSAILLVDVIREARERGLDPDAATLEGVRTRFRPIMMTSLSTVIGMIPLALELSLGAERFSPLAVAVIGGMTASTFLTLLVIPVMHNRVERWSTRPTLPTVPAGTLGAAALAAWLALPSAQAAPVELEEAWALARAHSAGLEAAAWATEAAEARAGAANGRALPTVELSARASYVSDVPAPVLQLPLTRPDGSPADPVQLGAIVREQGSLRANLTQPVYTGGALSAGRRAAEAGVDRARADEAAWEAALWRALSDAWYADALARKRVEVTVALAASAQAQEARLGALVQAGRASELQQLQVAARAAELAAEAEDARAQQALARARLERLTVPGVEPAPAALRDAANRQGAALPAEGERPELRAAEAAAEAAAARARVQQAALAPTVAVRLGAQYENPNPRYFPIRDEWLDSWDASVVATWTLDAGVRAREARASVAEAEAAQAARRALLDETALLQADAMRRREAAARQLQLADARADLAARALAETRRAEAAGRATALDLIEREADQARATLAAERAAYDWLVAEADRRALFGVWGP